MHTDPLIAAIQEKIDANEKALKPLLEERRYLDARLREATARYATTPPVRLQFLNSVVVAPVKSGPAQSPQPVIRKPTFMATPSGPQETLLDIIKNNGGIPSDKLYDLALVRVRGTAKNPRRSLAETLRKLILDKRVSRDAAGGLHIWP